MFRNVRDVLRDASQLDMARHDRERKPNHSDATF